MEQKDILAVLHCLLQNVTLAFLRAEGLRLMVNPALLLRRFKVDINQIRTQYSARKLQHCETFPIQHGNLK